MLKSKLTGFICTMVLTSVAGAQGLPPEKCPDIHAIQKQGVSIVAPSSNNRFIVSQLNQYDTNKQWFFAIGLINAKNEEAAIVKANKALLTVSGNPVPTPYDDDWVCEYNAPNRLMAAALLVDELSPIQRIKHYFAK